MPSKKPQTLKSTIEAPLISPVLPSPVMTLAQSLARTIAFNRYSNALMIAPATSPPRITLVQLIVPMVSSFGMESWLIVPPASQAGKPRVGLCENASAPFGSPSVMQVSQPAAVDDDASHGRCQRDSAFVAAGI